MRSSTGSSASGCRSAVTSTTRATPATRTRWPPSRRASACSTPRSAAPAGASSRPTPPATSPPRTSSTCCTAWASPPASTSTRSSTARSGWRPSSVTTSRARSARPARSPSPDVAGRTVTAKLMASHADGADADLLALTVDQALIEDATGTMAALQFEPLGAERCQVPLAVCYVDHNVLQIDERNQEDHRYLQAFCRRRGIHYSRPGNGISHYVHLERFGRPGQLMIGADSHTSTAGALAMLAVGVGGLEVAVAMAGRPFELMHPVVSGVELRGRLPPRVQAKDIVLELLRRHGVRGGVGRMFEFHGDGVARLSVPERATICNMVVETGATTGVFGSDDRTREWLPRPGRRAGLVPPAPGPRGPSAH